MQSILLSRILYAFIIPYIVCLYLLGNIIINVNREFSDKNSIFSHESRSMDILFRRLLSVEPALGYFAEYGNIFCAGFPD